MKISPIFHKEENDPATAARTVPLRADIPLADTWDLTALYPDVAAWQTDFEQVRTDYPRLAGFKGTLGRPRRTSSPRWNLKSNSASRSNGSTATPRCKTPRTAATPITSRAWRNSRTCSRASTRPARSWPPKSRPSTTRVQRLSWPTHARALENPFGKAAPLQAAHSFRSGGTPPRPRRAPRWRATARPSPS